MSSFMYKVPLDAATVLWQRNIKIVLPHPLHDQWNMNHQHFLVFMKRSWHIILDKYDGLRLWVFWISKKNCHHIFKNNPIFNTLSKFKRCHRMVLFKKVLFTYRYIYILYQYEVLICTPQVQSCNFWRSIYFFCTIFSLFSGNISWHHSSRIL